MKCPKHISTYISICVSLLWLTLLVYGFWYFFSQDLSLETLIFWLKNYIELHMLLGIWFFMCIYIIRPLFFIPASPFDVFAWMVFWPLYGFLICSVTLFFSAMFSYQVWYLTGGIVLEKKQNKKLNRLKSKLRKDTFWTTIMMRLIMLPYDLSNYICGVLQAPFLRYVLWTSIWVMPATAVFVGAGSAFYGQDITSFDTLLENVNYGYLIFSSGFFLTIIVVSRILKKRYKDISL